MTTPRLATLVLLAAAVAGCGTTQTRPSGPAASDGFVTSALDRAVVQYRAMDEAVPDSLLPRTTREDGSLWTHPPGWWTSGFFPGSLWHLHEYTGDPDLRARAEARTWLIEGEKNNVADHDIGFKINDSFGNALRITGDSARYVPVLVQAAETLVRRFDPDVGLIRSWGLDLNDKENP